MSTIQQQLDIPFERARQLGQETVTILKKGEYVSKSGRVIDLREKELHAVSNSVTYSPDKPLPISASGPHPLTITIQNTTTFDAARTLLMQGYKPAALNMASATSPGGGFLTGSRAQEEYLCRSSGLYPCLVDNEMYTRRDFNTNPFYDDYVIYSPDVPVFRDDDGELMDEPFLCSILTSPAVQAYGVYRFMPHRAGEIESIMWNRILKVLAVAYRHGHHALVLGAWGCGAFGNDGHMIARLFKTALTENFVGAFEKVTFAITDWSPTLRFIGPFLEVFRS